MREINQETIIEAVKQLCIEANSVLPCDVRQALKEAYVQEDSSPVSYTHLTLPTTERV